MDNRSPQVRPYRVIIAGGGTGGHVFPAIAIGRAIKEKHPDARILFTGAKGRMEMEKVPEAGFHIIGLNISGLQRRLTWKNLLVPFRLIDSLSRARNIVKRFKPDVVIGVGGYASAPLVRAAHRQRIPTLIQEQNSYPGLTNRMLGRKADRICVAYTGMEKWFAKEKIYLTGNPVRQDLLEAEKPEKKSEALAYFGLSAGKPLILAMGGSLGALSVNQGVMNGLEAFRLNKIQLIWQTGRSFYETALKNVEALGGNSEIKVYPFITRMDLAYALADVVVSRAGAIAISEISALKKPSLLIPSPYVAEDHQTRNAKALVNQQAAQMLTEQEAPEKLAGEAIALINDEERMQRMKEKLAGLSFRKASEAIASMALGLIH